MLIHKMDHHTLESITDEETSTYMETDRQRIEIDTHSTCR